jgi:hypothetical protein
MTRLAGRAGLPVTAVALTGLIIVACGRFMPDNLPAVPAEFRAACGHPGAEVVVREVPVTVKHADCDLTGVAISYPGRGGATVPAEGGASVSTSSGFTLTVHPGTLDVTVTVTGPAGNA